jgi:hypothetical protein
MTTTVWCAGLLLGASPLLAGAFRNSVGLSVKSLSNCTPPAGSSEYRDLAFDEDELVRAESLRELFRRLSVSCVNADALFRWRTFRVNPASLLEDDDPELVPDRPEIPVLEDPHD